MKTAIVHDELLRKGGAERVVISLHKLYPEADIFTLAYKPEGTFDYFKECNVKTSFLNAIVKSEKWLMALFFPFGIIAMRLFNLKGYDLIILSSAHGAQYIKKPKGTKVINYAHYVFRLIWEPKTYKYLSNSVLFLLLYPLISFLRLADKKLTVTSDFTVFNSKKTQKKYLKVFNRINDYCIINPPIDLSGFKQSDEINPNFLVVSRFEPYKKVDLVIRAFVELGERLIVVGSGTLEDDLRQLASGSTNITFETGVSDERLKELFSSCQALIFPQVEDFGITPLECNASGRPVIAYAEGGVLETMVDGETALFFREQTVAGIVEAVNLFRNKRFDSNRILDNAARFDEVIFHDKFESVVIDTLKT